MKKFMLGCLFLLVTSQSFIRAQNSAIAPPAAAPGSLKGVVTVSGTGSPLPNAVLRLENSGGAVNLPATTISDDAGNFYFSKIEPGNYRLFATRPGYIRVEYGQPEPDAEGTLITVAAGATAADLRIAMIPGGVISGRITDLGRPAAGVPVIARKVSNQNGVRKLDHVLSGLTDDRGEYHIFWLPPGQYYVAAYPGDSSEAIGYTAPVHNINGSRGGGPPAIPQFLSPAGDRQGWYAESISARSVLNKPISVESDLMRVVMYYPNTPDPDAAATIDVVAGGETPGIDIDAPMARARRVRGVISGMPQPAPVNLQQRGGRGLPPEAEERLAASQNATSLLSRIRITLSGANAKPITVSPNAAGAFEFPRVAPGVYFLTATSPLGNGNPANGTMLGASASVDVLNGDADVALTLAALFRVSGDIVIEPPLPGSPNPLPGSGIAAVSVTLRPVPWQPGASEYTVEHTNNGANDAAQRVQAERGSSRATFTIPAGIPAGDYSVIVKPLMVFPTDRLPPAEDPFRPVFVVLQDAYVKSIRLGDVDVLKSGLHLEEQPPQGALHIVVGKSPAVVTGRVVNERKEPVANATLAFIPDGPLRSRIENTTTTSGPDGTFQLPGLAPGDYKVLGWERVEKFAWRDSDFLRRYEDRAAMFRVEEGRSQKLPFDIVVIARER